MSYDFVKIPRKMGDLHSIAYCGNLHNSSLGWDHFHNLGLLNADFSHFMESNSTPPFYSTLDSDLSTGYLQDALFEFNSKRRRLLLFSDYDDDNHQTNQSTYPVPGYWNSNCIDNLYDKSDDLSHMNYVDNVVAGKAMESTVIIKGIREEEEETNVKKSIVEEETNLGWDAIDSSSSSQSKSSVNTQYLSDHDKETTPPYNSLYPLSPSDEGEKRKRRVVTRVVYPFAMVKPGGFEGDTTLNDINKRILMPPTRPVKHPVGDFACRPLVSPDGPGLSGKAVVALTRIQTQGRGTITIIRTKG